MATSSLFSFLEGFLQNSSLRPNLEPPAWVLVEAQRRVISLLNHILMQETEATNRLVRHKGRVVLLQWRSFALKLVATGAGLLDQAVADATPDLVLALTEESALALAKGALRGDKPAVRIEGDVQLAADVNWLVDHVHWEIEEDLSRVIGDAPAHAMGQIARAVKQSLRQFLGTGVGEGLHKAQT